jgi:LemA protein
MSRHLSGAAGAPLEAHMIGWIVLVIVVVVVGYAVVAYNNLVRQRQLTQEGWSGIDVQLKRRADLIPNLMEAVKGYMKASQNFLQFQTALQSTEDELQLSRRYYNGTARDLNTAVESFPSNILANIFHFAKVQFFEIDNPADRAVPTVKF